MWYHIIVGVCFLAFNSNAQILGGDCKTPLGESGKCIRVYDCQSTLPLLRLPTRTAQQLEFLRSSRCGFDSTNTPHVCCGSTIYSTAEILNEGRSYTPNPLIPDRNNCGFQVSDRVIGGESTNFDEFPWMAVFESVGLNGRRLTSCAGSLISPRYVLTAAHCVKGDILTIIGQPMIIRLGDYNVTNPGRDCTTRAGITFCNQQEVDVSIDEVIPHPSYSGDGSRFHDIALVRLATEVKYSEFIQPVCLPLPHEASEPGEKLWVAGWGKTERGRSSDVKLKVEVPITSLSQCFGLYQRLNITIGRSHVCAGGATAKDTCTGDSGSPLMRPLPTDSSRWMIEGVVSFGYRHCGTKGYPGVYTKVADYVAWIHDTVRA